MPDSEERIALTPVPTISGDWPIIPETLRIVKKIGEGGMAKVYKAIQEPLEREIALKILTVPTNDNIRRFRHESKIMASFQHENIVGVHDMYSKNSRLFMLMELVEGVDLTQILENKEPVPPVVAAGIILKVARALEYIHARNILHRDIKPGNIIMSYHGDIKITDFGISRELNSSDKNKDNDSSMGTPSYMSPEQLLGTEQDGRSDIYSLGIVFYRLLTGAQPFLYSSQDTLFSKIVGHLPLAPRHLLPSVPQTLEKIVMKCIAKRKEDRYRNATVLQRELERYLSKHNPSMNFKAIFIRFLEEKSFLDSQTTNKQLKKLEECGYDISTHKSSGISWLVILILVLFILLGCETILLFRITGAGGF
ncbi:MAG: serine/threonine protein kinase [Deltaproteobacteria bacterium]|nr:serine/threonine protein kinase [Deltaproteobacteria bacterium]